MYTSPVNIRWSSRKEGKIEFHGNIRWTHQEIDESGPQAPEPKATGRASGAKIR